MRARAHLAAPILLAALFAAPPASAQAPLSLSEAIARARARNPDAGSAAAAEREAAEHVTQVRGGFLPRVDFVESWQRGNHPVFVFSSLLAQRQFATGDLPNLRMDALNHPDATDSFRAVLRRGPLFDRTTAANIRAASIGRDMAATKTTVDHDLTAAVTGLAALSLPRLLVRRRPSSRPPGQTASWPATAATRAG
jgi:outer membrane protein TolC